jgi:predicted nuclease with TOPRIM domain
MSRRKNSNSFEVTCPCCHATLQIDPQVQAVLTHKAHEKPRELKDLETGLERLKAEEAKREEVFRKSVEAEKKQHELLEKKFQELFKKAKETDDGMPPQRDIDLD